MILDKEMELASEQVFTDSANSAKSLDLGPNTWAGNSVGDDNLKLFLSVAEAGAGAGAVTFQLRSSANEDMSDAVIHEQSRPILATDLKIGGAVPYHPNIPHDADRYVDVRMVVTGDISAGKININGVSSRQMNG